MSKQLHFSTKDSQLKMYSPNKQPQSVMFVCLGNIIRSPLCEGLFRKLTKSQIKVDSSAVTTYNIGEKPALNAQIIAKENRFDISNHISKKITKKDFITYELIVSLEPQVTLMLNKIKPKNFNGKIIELIKGTKVKNPYNMPYDCFQEMYKQIEEGITNLIETYFKEYQIKS